MIEQKEKCIYIKVTLVFIFILQVLWITYSFATEKEGFHSDEPWSYGFANSYFEPYLYATGNFNPNEPIEQKNYGEWVSGDIFREYLTVGDNDAFRFDSIYYNTAYDQSPPLYCILLHVISSFFRNSFSFWYAYIINLISFVISQVALFRISKMLSKNEVCAIFVCVLYGFSLAGLSTTIFLRMYALLACFCLLYVYALLKIYLKKGNNIRFESVSVIILLLLGGLTHYSFFIFAFFMTLCMLILILVGKKEEKIKSCIHMAGISLMGVGFSFLFYPYAIYSIFSQHDLQDSSVIKMPYWYNFEILLSYLSIDTLGVDWYYDRFDLLNTIAGGIVLVCIITLLCFACRKEKWFLPLKEKYIHPLLSFLTDKERMYKFVNSHTNWFAVCLFISMWITMMISARICKVFEMGRFADRYIFFLMPIWDILVVCACFAFGKRIFRRKTVLALVFTLILILCSLIMQKQDESVYLFKNTNLKQLTNLTSDKDCIVVTNKAWALQWYSAALYDVKRFFAIDITQYQKQMKSLSDSDELNNGECCYLILEQACFSDVASDETINLNTAGSDVSEETFLMLLSDTCEWMGDIKYLYTQYGFRGGLDVFEITISK